MANVPEKAPDGGEKPNRLIDETSPYLLQHARNPVAWYPWGPEAFEKAAREDKPVFLSVGYSSCHWCHVMAHESFEDPEVAQILNDHFVAVKVDREERPDVDATYMLATQVLTGRGGWPNSLWLTPAGQCWYAGTYFPREDQPGGHTGFKTILRRLSQLWSRQRKDVEQQAAKITATLIQYADASGPPPEGPLSFALLEQATRRLQQSFDPKFGGFDAAPKFPPHGALLLLAAEFRRTGDVSLLAMLESTLDAMARGGIRDHLGGGFHRYSTDARWLVPHFEKMLYDNAQLIRAYVEGFRLTARPDFRQVALEACRWVLADMTEPGGAFASALDADSEGREGLYYIWTHQELRNVLGPQAGDEFARLYGATPQGNFLDEATGERPGANILHLPRPIEQAAADLHADPHDLALRLQQARDNLLARRSQRVPPGKDDKVLVGWNGLMISALAQAGKEFDQPDLTAAAARAAECILSTMQRDGRLLRTSRGGLAKLPACLEDYAFLADALLDLYQATGKTPWLARAIVLAETMVARYADPAGAGFFVTPDDHDDYRGLLHRIKDPLDQAVPSGNAVALRVLIRLAALTGNGHHHVELVARTLRSFQGLMERVPNGTAALLLAAGEYLRAPLAPTTHAPHPHPHALASSGPLRAELFASDRTCRPGEPVEVTVAISLEPGWHIIANPASDVSLAPATLTLRQTPLAALTNVTYPPGELLHPAPDAPPALVYRDRTCIRALLQPSPALPASLLTLTLTLTAQPCGPDHCLSPVTLDLPLTLDVGAPQTSS